MSSNGQGHRALTPKMKVQILPWLPEWGSLLNRLGNQALNLGNEGANPFYPTKVPMTCILALMAGDPAVYRNVWVRFP